MLLIFDTLAGDIVRSAGGPDHISEWTWSDRDMNRDKQKDVKTLKSSS